MAAATLALADAPGTNVTRTAYRLLREVGLTDSAARAFLAEAAGRQAMARDVAESLD